MGMRIMAQAEIEELIVRLTDEMEEETDRYSVLADEAANAEADYKLGFARAVVGLADSQARMTAPERQARAEVAAGAELRLWKIAEARRQATKEALLTLRARLDALRSLAANIRNQT